MKHWRAARVQGSNACTGEQVRHKRSEVLRGCAGEGEGFCDGRRFPLAAGDLIVFPPRSMHGIDVAPSGRLYALVRWDAVHA